MTTGRRSPTALRFARVHLENWRNFTLADVELSQRVFVVGPNAAGKSNFLDVFRFLHDIVSVGGGLEEAVRKRQGVSKLRALSAREFPDVVVRVDLNGSNGESWRYELALSQDSRQRPQIKREMVFRGFDMLFQRPDDADQDDPERLTQTYLQQVNVNKDFRPVADAFAAVRYLHIVPQLIRGRGWVRAASLCRDLRGLRLRRSEDTMSQAGSPKTDEVRPEYDFSGGVRGKHYPVHRAGTNVVVLEDDVAAAFPDSPSVNRALRLLMDLAKKQVSP